MRLWEETGGIKAIRYLSVLIDQGVMGLDQMADFMDAMCDLPNGMYMVKIYRKIPFHKHEVIKTEHYFGVVLDGKYKLTVIGEQEFDWALQAQETKMYKQPPELGDF